MRFQATVTYDSRQDRVSLVAQFSKNKLPKTKLLCRLSYVNRWQTAGPDLVLSFRADLEVTSLRFMVEISHYQGSIRVF